MSDPVEDGVQRWEWSDPRDFHGDHHQDPDGPWVTYTDHVAAVQQARDAGYGEAMDDGWGEPRHIANAVEAVQVTARRECDAHVAAAVQAERERIRTGVDAVWTDICGDWRNPDQCDMCSAATTILAVIGGGSDA